MFKLKSVFFAVAAIAMLAAFHRSQFLSPQLFHQGESFVQISSKKLAGKFYGKGISSKFIFHIRVVGVRGENLLLHVEASDGTSPFSVSPFSRYDVGSMMAFTSSGENITPTLSVLYGSTVWGALPVGITVGDHWTVHQPASGYFPTGLSAVQVIAANANAQTVTLGISGKGAGLSGSDIENPSNLLTSSHDVNHPNKVFKTKERVLGSTWKGRISLHDGLVTSSEIRIETTISEPATPVLLASTWIRSYTMRSKLISVSH